MSANFVGNTLTRSEAIEIYTPYDVTSPRPRKTTIAFFANFGGIEKLFCVVEFTALPRIQRIQNLVGEGRGRDTSAFLVIINDLCLHFVCYQRYWASFGPFLSYSVLFRAYICASLHYLSHLKLEMKKKKKTFGLIQSMKLNQLLGN